MLPASKLDPEIKNPHKGTASPVRYTKTCMNIRNGRETKVTENTRYYVSSLTFSRENATQSCDFDYLSSVFGINKIAFNILSYIRQDKISKSQSRRHPSFSAVQDILNSKRLSHVFRYIARYCLESEGEQKQA